MGQIKKENGSFSIGRREYKNRLNMCECVGLVVKWYKNRLNMCACVGKVVNACSVSARKCKKVVFSALNKVK